MNSSANQSICPFCGNKNKCMAQSDKPCWCSDVNVPKRLIELVPPDLKRKSCICLDCINSFIVNSTQFERQLNNS
ncbi:MAG: hypothetical protein GQ470_00680 [Gammaproteobacteria bacterium]|nr:hypothetical protein [Gammaproteobacteria bacterium]